jgi:hypothetical protein
MRIEKTKRIVASFLGACIIGIAGYACAGTEQSIDTLPASIKGQLRKFPQQVRLLELVDMDSSSCGALEANPGLVTGDFNGDGRPDYATLLISIVPKREQTWNGRKLTLVDAWFVVFLQQGDGTYDRNDIEHLEIFLPSGTGLAIQPAGPVKEFESGKVINLKTPAVEWYFCEKGASVHYWNGKSFLAVQTSD